MPVPLRRIWPPIAMIGTVLYFVLPLRQQSVLYAGLSVAAAVLVLLGPGRTSDARRGWQFVGAGQALTAAGDGIWTWYEVVERTAPFPGIADVVYLSGYLGFAAGLLVLAHAAGRRDPGALIDAAVVAIGSGAVGWITLVAPYVHDPSLTLPGRLASIAYPAGDLLLLSLLLRLLFSGPARRHPALLLLAAGFGFALMADLAFGWMSLQGTYDSGHPIDAGWLISYLLIGAAALHPAARSVAPTQPVAFAPVLPRSRLLLLVTSSMMAPAVVVTAGLEQAAVDLVVVGAASAVLFALVLWRMAGMVRHISAQAAKLQELSTTDPLTGVANRRRWDEELATAVARAGRSGESLAVVLLDIDHFKRFNDTFGHQAGDRLLMRASAAWQAQLRPGDLLARVGGEEFALLLLACDEARAMAVVNRLRAVTPEGCTCSAGIAVLEPTDTATDLMTRADVAMYEAKAAGRDRAVIAAPLARS